MEDVDGAVAGAELREPVPDGVAGGASRAARGSSSGSPRASSAASVAEWVQPAPCVARDVEALDRDLDVLPAVEEMVDRDRRARR